VRHIPVPEQGSALSSSGGTPTDFMAQPVAHDWNNLIQPLEMNDAQPPDLDPTRDLLAAAANLSIDFLGTIPSVANFPAGPGDDDGGPGWT
jgi:hypothetical protein